MFVWPRNYTSLLPFVKIFAFQLLICQHLKQYVLIFLNVELENYNFMENVQVSIVRNFEGALLLLLTVPTHKACIWVYKTYVYFSVQPSKFGLEWASYQLIFLERWVLNTLQKGYRKPMFRKVHWMKRWITCKIIITFNIMYLQTPLQMKVCGFNPFSHSITILLHCSERKTKCLITGHTSTWNCNLRDLDCMVSV